MFEYYKLLGYHRAYLHPVQTEPTFTCFTSTVEKGENVWNLFKVNKKGTSTSGRVSIV